MRSKWLNSQQWDNAYTKGNKVDQKRTIRRWHIAKKCLNAPRMQNEKHYVQQKGVKIHQYHFARRAHNKELIDKKTQ
jgi:lipoate-protein ligase A